MRMEKKRVLKDDGRYLTFYHFPETATEEEAQVFNALVAGETLVAPHPAPANKPGEGEQPHV